MIFFFVGVMRPWQKIVLVTTIIRGTHYLMVNSDFFVVFLNKSSNTPKSHKLLSTYMFEMYKLLSSLSISLFSSQMYIVFNQFVFYFSLDNSHIIN